MRQVIIHKADEDETGFWAECPSLGVVSQGETIEETIANIREAIALWLDVAHEYGDAIPPEDAEHLDHMVIAV